MSETTARLFAIRGYMKSGTNWIGRLLNLHPEVSCVGEFHWERITQPMTELLQRLTFLPQASSLRHCATERVQSLIADSVRAANRSGSTWVGDRTPGTIDWHYMPDAHFFNVVRDGRDVLVSRAFHLLRRPDTSDLFKHDEVLRRNLHNFENNPDYFREVPHELLGSESLVRQTARTWVRIVTANQDAIERNPARVLSVRYESLHADIELARRELYEFLSLDPELAHPLDERTQPGFKQERPQDLLRKGQIGDWQEYFTPDVETWFFEEAGAMLRQLGYVD